MTQNQIRYAELKEAQRHNSIVERETERHNRATVAASNYAAQAAHRQAAVVEAMLPYNQWKTEEEAKKADAERIRANEQANHYLAQQDLVRQQEKESAAKTLNYAIDSAIKDIQATYMPYEKSVSLAGAQAGLEYQALINASYNARTAADITESLSRTFSNAAKGVTSFWGSKTGTSTTHKWDGRGNYLGRTETTTK